MLTCLLSLRAEVVRAVPGGVPIGLVRAAVLGAAELPEVAARLPEGDSEVVIRLTGDRELRRLNRRFLGEDAATDVLAFPSETAGQDGHLGDIALSLPAARRQASAFDHSLQAETALLCVHGFLHLLGWDHATAAEAAEMNRLTLAVLASMDQHLAAGRLAT
jgi:probable rRNA maturation factor